MNTKNRYVVLVLVILFVSPILVYASSSPPPKTSAELALYNGSDRQQILEEGAKKERNLTFYTTGILVQTVRPIVNAFQKKYPYIKVNVWRGQTTDLIPRLREESKAGRYTADVVELTQTGSVLMEEAGMLQPFYSPELVNIEEGAIRTAPDGGSFTAAHYQSGISLGYNTKLLKSNEIPKTNQDLLEPKWKGKMAIVSANTGSSWVGTMYETYGEEFIKKLASQKLIVHEVSGRALLDMIIAGEYALSPTIFDSHARKSNQAGAPCNWVPLEPVPSFLGQIMLPKNSPHPHAAMLFIDFDLSRQAGELYVANGYNSPRKDIEVERNYKKSFGPWSTKQAIKWTQIYKKYFIKP